MRDLFLLSMRIMAMVVILATTFIIIGCTRKVYLPVETVRIQKDTVSIVRADRDSVVIKDSVAIVCRNDTVYKEAIRWRIRDRVLRDTVLRTRIDTVYLTTPLPNAGSSPKSDKPSFGQRLFYTFLDSWLSPILLIVLIFLIYRLFRFRK